MQLDPASHAKVLVKKKKKLQRCSAGRRDCGLRLLVDEGYLIGRRGPARVEPRTQTTGPRDLLSTDRLPGTMDDLNPADFTALQPYLNPVRVKRGVRKQVLDDAAGQFPGGLVLFEDN